MYFDSGIHGYEYLKKTGYPLPSLRTIYRKLQNHDIELGVFYNLKHFIKAKMESLHSTDRWCCLSIDEMQILQSQDYDKVKKKFLGYVSLGKTSELATHLLVVMVRGLKTKWKQVIACVSTAKSTNNLCMKQLLHECIDFCTECDLKVVSVTSDMGGNNVSLWNNLNVFAQRDSLQNFFTYKDQDIYITPDVCHLLKNLRNAMHKWELNLPSDICENEKLPTSVIRGKYIRLLWQAEL